MQRFNTNTELRQRQLNYEIRPWALRRRLLTEPPEFDYRAFESILEEQKETNGKKGWKDISWWTDVLDNEVERVLLEQYQDWSTPQFRNSY